MSGHLKGASLARVCSGLTHKQSLPGTNALAYYEKSQLTVVKSFITHWPLVSIS